MPNCSIFDQLYVFSTTELFFLACKASTVDLGNIVLKILNDIMLLLLSDSILYVMHAYF